MSNSRAVRAVLAACLTALLLGACGQRGPLYIPGKPGDPYFDRQNRGTSSAPGASAPGAARDSTKAANTPEPVPAPKREDTGNN